MGSEALSREQARSKQGLCAEAEKDGNAEIGECLDKQFKTTEQNYLAYVRSIGALVRLSLPDDSPAARVAKSCQVPVLDGRMTWSRLSPQTYWQGKSNSMQCHEQSLRFQREYAGQMLPPTSMGHR